jgi:hypothetical protein
MIILKQKIKFLVFKQFFKSATSSKKIEKRHIGVGDGGGQVG